MYITQSRRGFTQITNHNNRHAQSSLISISSALTTKGRYSEQRLFQDDPHFKTQGGDPEQKHIRMTSLINNKCVEDPRVLLTAKSGMTPNWIPLIPALRTFPLMGKETHRGFTLIELLVVVLIIGLLAAVALPQYNKAVKRAQGREVYVALNALDKALQAYYLENGTYSTQTGSADFPGQLFPAPLTQQDLNVEIPAFKYFWFEYGNTQSHSFESGYASYLYDEYSVSIRPPEIQAGSMSVLWRKGKRSPYMYCSSVDLCAQYLEGTIQIGSAGDKTFILN